MSVFAQSGLWSNGMVSDISRLSRLVQVILALSVILLGFQGVPFAESKTVSVGVYQNRPLIFTQGSEPKGIFIRVLEEVAQRKDWKLDYVQSDWKTVFERLKQGKIDILPVVAFSEARREQMDFSRVTLLTNWGQVFTRTGLDVESIQDLRGRRIALQPDDTHARHFADLLNKLNIPFTRVFVGKYKRVFKALEEEEVDAGVVNRLFANANAPKYSVQSTPIVFNPIEIRYAVPKGDPANLLTALDNILPELKNSHDSVFHRATEKWLGSQEPVIRYPEWFFELFVGLGALFAIGGLAIVWLRIEVKRKTREIRQANARLAESERKYRRVIETAMEGFLLVDTGGRIAEVNPAYADMSGYDMNELTGMRIDQLAPEGGEEDFEERVKGALHIGSERFEARNRRKDGSIFHVEVCISHDSLGADMIACFVRDVSERKQAEEALRESEAKYRLLAENSADVIWTMDPRGRYTFVSPSVRRIYGLAPENVVSRSIYEHLPSEEQEFVECFLSDPSSWENLLEDTNDPVYRSELRQIRRDGSMFWTEVLVSPMWGESGEIVGFQGATRDITERKEMEATLLEEEEKYRKLFDTSPDAIALVDEEGSFLTVNPAMAERFDLSRQELQNKTFWDVMPCELARRRIAHGKEAIEQGRLIYYEDEREERYFQNYYVPVSVSGERNTFQVISRDVTQSRRLQARLKEMGLFDALTGLYNRGYFEEEMRRLSDGRYLPLGIIVCDINGLKLINDTLGHSKGDEMLKVAAGILRQCFRDSDIIARIGGDEFAVLLPMSDHDVVSGCCERIRCQIARYQDSDPEFGISISVGYAVRETPPVDVDALFKWADDAMYKEKLQQSYSSRSEIVQALIKTLEARDYITEGHAGRLHKYAHKLGQHVGLSEERLNDLQLLARFHDLGKVGVPDRILFKPGRLTEEEFREMKQHCEIGHRIAMSTSDLAPIADFILKHHEHWDGRGYPLGLSGLDIPLECRILAIVDAYDTMTSERPYKFPMSTYEAIEELKRCSGTQFDPDLVKVFIRIVQGEGNA